MKTIAEWKLLPEDEIEDLCEFAVHAEYDWCYVAADNYDRLHCPQACDEDDGWGMVGAPGITLCGLTGRLEIPGIPSRMGLQRCDQCCDLKGYPRGIGSPKNERAIRELEGWPIASRPGEAVGTESVAENAGHVSDGGSVTGNEEN